MPTAFGSSIVSATFDPTKRPMYNPADITKSNIDMWIAFLEGIVNLIPGANEIVALIKGITGVDLLSFEQVFAGIDLNDPGAVLTAIETAVENLGTGLIGQLFKLLGGDTSTGVGNSSPTGILGLLGELSQIPGELWAVLTGQQASNQAQIDAYTSGGFSYDPARDGVTGWSTLTSTALALSSLGHYIQPTVETVAYRSSGIASDKYGASMVIDPTMRGVTGLAICADSAGASWIGLLAYRGFDGDALWLVKGASPTLWVIVKRIDLTGSNKLASPSTIDLKTDGVSLFTVRLNGTVVTWPDDGKTVWSDGGLATHNSTHRGVMMLANVLNRNELTYLGPAIKGKVVSYAA